MPLSSHTLQVSSPAIPMHLGRPALEPVRLSGHEGLNSLFSYELLLKTPDSLNLGASGAADWELDSFIGREISCSIELDGMGQFVAGAVGASVDHLGQGTRQINALITEASLWGEEGRHVQYKLTLRPWLHLATLTTDCKVFQNKTVVQVLDELLADYPFAVDKRLIGLEGPSGSLYALRDYQVQFNETDHQFFERLCQEHGISYFFEHSEGKHRLVLIDSMGAYQKMPSAAYQRIEYHPPGWKLDAEYIHSFVPQHRLTSGRYATSDYDYTRPKASLAVSRSDPRPTGHATGAAVSEVYQWHDAVARRPAYDLGPYKADYQLFKTDNRPFEAYDYEVHGNQGALLESDRTSAEGQTFVTNTEQSIALKACKSVMRESERLVENWSAVLDAKVDAASSKLKNA